jgi:hypothetical protein
MKVSPILAIGAVLFVLALGVGLWAIANRAGGPTHTSLTDPDVRNRPPSPPEVPGSGKPDANPRAVTLGADD